ncbi:MAG: hypothetical protein ACP6IP_01600 [Candidatus Njordarchaeia archaeon]
MNFNKLLMKSMDHRILMINFFNAKLYLVDSEGYIYLMNFVRENAEVNKVFYVKEKVLDFDLHNGELFILTSGYLYIVDLNTANLTSLIPVQGFFKVYKPKLSGSSNIFLLGNTDISVVESGRLESLFRLSERYMDLICEDIYKKGEVNVVLRSLWGFTIYNMEGKQISHRSFGDVVVGTKLCLGPDGSKILVGSKNGNFSIFHVMLERMSNLDLRKSVYLFDVVCPTDKYNPLELLWCSYDGAINYTKIENGEISESKEVVKLYEPCDKLIAFKYEEDIYLVVVSGEKIEIWRGKP